LIITSNHSSIVTTKWIPIQKKNLNFDLFWEKSGFLLQNIGFDGCQEENMNLRRTKRTISPNKG
jgi:hypothetical protein